MKCFDRNTTELAVNDGIMYVSNGKEYEGVISKLLEGNKIVIDTEEGILTVDASDTFYLP